MATFDYNRVNLGSARLITSITESSTTINVGTGDAETLPAVPFYATIMPSGGVPNTLNSEIVKVTANNSGTLTVVRAQRGTYAKEFPIGAVLMNGTYVEDLLQGQAVGKSFFSATLSGGVFSIDDSRLTNNPADGDSIRVVFGSDLTSGNCQLSLNGGTAKNVYAGGNLSSAGGTASSAMVKSGVIYELTYYNGSWYILNLNAGGSITDSNINWGSMKRTPLVFNFGSGAETGTMMYSKLANIKFASHRQGETCAFRVFLSDGQNGRDNQEAYMDIIGTLGWTGSDGGRAGWNVSLDRLMVGTDVHFDSLDVKVVCNSNIDYDIYVGTKKKYVCFATSAWVPYNSTLDIITGANWSETPPSGNLCNVGFSYNATSIRYSTEERRTGDFWTDGKPIYRKVLSGTFTNTSGQDLFQTIWGNSGVSDIVKAYGTVDYGGGGRVTVPFAETDNSTTQYAYVYKQQGGTNIVMRFKRNDAVTNRPYRIVLEYTKN